MTASSSAADLARIEEMLLSHIDKASSDEPGSADKHRQSLIEVIHSFIHNVEAFNIRNDVLVKRINNLDDRIGRCVTCLNNLDDRIARIEAQTQAQKWRPGADLQEPIADLYSDSWGARQEWEQWEWEQQQQRGMGR